MRKNIIVAILAGMLAIVIMMSCVPNDIGTESGSNDDQGIESTITPTDTPVATPESTPESTTEATPEETPEPAPEIENLYDKSKAYPGYVSADGVEHPYAGHFMSDYISVTPGTKIYFGPCNANQDYQLHGYNSSKKNVDSNVSSKLVEEEAFPNSYVIYSYTVPSNVKYVRLANPAKYNDVYTVSSKPFSVDDFASYWGAANTMDLLEKRNSDGYIEYVRDVFTDKKALFLGDSICAANCESGKSYRGWCGRIESSTGMRCVNRGVSGASISTCRGSNRVINQYIAVMDRDFDFVIMHGGVNDAWESAAVGTVSSSYELKDFNVNTYAGGLEELFYYVTKNHPNAKLGYIFNFATPSFKTGRIANMTEYYNVAKKICEKWNIPFLNMYEDNKLSSELTVTTTAHLSDYLHPNTAGYDVLYKYIMYWMETLPVHSEIGEDYELQSYPIKK